jgi:hypothetical protein
LAESSYKENEKELRKLRVNLESNQRKLDGLTSDRDVLNAAIDKLRKEQKSVKSGDQKKYLQS